MKYYGTPVSLFHRLVPSSLFLRQSRADVNAPASELADVLGNETTRYTNQVKIPDAWAPYESKLVKQ